MKIISKPDVSQWCYRYKCIKCDSELEVESKDLNRRYYSGDYREPSYEAYSAKCAVCGDSFSIPDKHIPKLVKLEVRARTKDYYE